MHLLRSLGSAVLATLLCVPNATPAQVSIQKVRAGFPAFGKNAPEGRTYYKAGAWVPIQVQLPATGPNDFGPCEVIADTADSDDVRNRFAVPVKPLAGNKSHILFGYTRPGSVGAPIGMRVEHAENQVQEYRKSLEAEALDFSKQLYLTVGARLADLPQALHGLEPDPQRLQIRYAAAVEQVDDLPDRWFGYDAVDLLILTTGRLEFVRALQRDKERRQALAEWVQRGGRLLVSLAPRNSARILDLFQSWQPDLPAVLTTKVLKLQYLESPVQFGEVPLGQPFQARGSASVEMAQLRTGGTGIGPVETLALERPGLPLLIRVPYGLGSVTFLAIGLDEEPFTKWEGRTRFWQKLVKRLGPGGGVAGGSSSGSRSPGAAENDLATDLQKELETFPDVRPALFGLVAFLIFLYILVVGPLDYFFLKRVIKRLQWTWITYLALVIAVSALAFSSACGPSDQRPQVNQIVLLDIDQLGPEPRVRGTSWFTLYSPRLESYNVGLKGEDEGPDRRILLTWMGRPEFSGLNSTGRQRSETLFRAKYDYDWEGKALRSVPVPYAGTKSFKASWDADFSQGFGGRLYYEPAQGMADRVAGTVTNPLPVELGDAILCYGGKWFTFTGPLLAGGKATIAQEATTIEFDDWVHYRKETHQGRRGSFQATKLIKNILFHEKLDPRGTRRDHVLRNLDQSWRTYEPNTREAPIQMAILYARLPRREGTLARVNASGRGLSGLRISRANAGVQGQRLDGELIQDIYVRVYLPVVPAKQKK